MSNHPFFSFRRFAAYFSKRFIEQWRTNAIRCLLLFAGLLIVLMLIAVNTYPDLYLENGIVYDETDFTKDPIDIIEESVFLLSLFAVGILMASQLLHDGRRKPARIAMLTTPVSPFENWLTRWLMHMPLPLVVFLVCFHVADAIRVAVFAPIYPELGISLFWLGADDFTVTGTSNIALAYACCTTFYLVGGTFFPRRAVLATSVVALFAGLYFALILMTFSFSSVKSPYYDYSPQLVFIQVYLWATVLLGWWLSYRRFRELEVIDRI